jgi:hypothetical protein
MYYTIENFGPHRDNGRLMPGGYGFNIKLYPGFKKLVAEYGNIDDEAIFNWRKRYGKWLLEDYGWQTDTIRIAWGEWGLEHIQVPGNACTLDYDTFSQLGAPKDGIILTPHNVDTLQQAGCLLSVFTWFANYMLGKMEIGGP